jgi:hypothetical protein
MSILYAVYSRPDPTRSEEIEALFHSKEDAERFFRSRPCLRIEQYNLVRKDSTRGIGDGLFKEDDGYVYNRTFLPWDEQ